MNALTFAYQFCRVYGLLFEAGPTEGLPRRGRSGSAAPKSEQRLRSLNPVGPQVPRKVWQPDEAKTDG